MSLSPRMLCGRVISAGNMSKAVKVRVTKQTYYGFFRKHFGIHKDYLVADPTNSTRTGDVVRIVSTSKMTSRIKHAVKEIVTPFGPPIEARPALPSTH